MAPSDDGQGTFESLRDVFGFVGSRLPSFNSRSPSLIFLTACSAVCLCRFMIVSILSSHQRDMTNTHSTRLTSQGPRHGR